jgi:hypothetical protein
MLILSRPGFHESAQRLGKNAAEFPESKRCRSFKEYLSIAFILHETMHVLPQVRGVDLGVDEVH